MAPRRSPTEAAFPAFAAADGAQALLGHRFVDALVAKDGAALASLLTGDVDFRAVTPSATWQADDPGEVAQIVLGRWFAPDRVIERVVSTEVDESLAVARVGYRFEVRQPHGRSVIEQQALYQVRDGLMSTLWLCCTGFLPLDAS
jgi:hypothetical protein